MAGVSKGSCKGVAKEAKSGIESAEFAAYPISMLIPKKKRMLIFSTDL